MRKAMIIGLVFGGLGVAPAAAKENHEARRVLASFAECVVKDSRAVTSRAIVEDWDSKALIEHKSKPISSSCLRGAGFIAQLRASPQMMKAAIAEQLVRRDKIVVQAADVAKLAPLNYRMPTPVVTVNARTGKPCESFGSGDDICRGADLFHLSYAAIRAGIDIPTRRFWSIVDGDFGSWVQFVPPGRQPQPVAPA